MSSSKKDYKHSMMDSDTDKRDYAGDDDGPAWAKKQYSSLHNLITSVEQRLQKRYDSFEERLVILEEKVTAATSCSTSAKQVADDSAALVTNFREELNSAKHIVQESVSKIKLCDQTLLQEKFEKLKQMVLTQETYSRRPNLIFRGLTWDKREPCENSIRRFLVEVMLIPEARSWHFINCHPLDRSNHPAIMVRFAFPQHRQIVWQKHGILKSSKFYISEDYPSDVEHQRRFFYPIVARANHITEFRGKVTMTMDKLIYNGKSYTVKDLHTLPSPINPKTLSQMENDNYVCIGGVSSCFNGISNFYVRNFKLDSVMFNGIKHDECMYNSVEQGFHHIKAKHFRDEKTAEMLLSEEDPGKQKQLSKSIANFSNITWDKIKDDVMKCLIMSKFSQHADLKQLLLDTGTKCVLEANHNDQYWSTGLAIGRDNFDRRKWKGTNKLGLLLDGVKTELRG